MNTTHNKGKKLIAIILTCLMIFVMVPEFSFAQTGSAGSRVITGFVELENSEYTFDGEPSEAELVKGLPDTIDVYLNGSDSAVPIDVTWECVEDYDETEFFFYSVKPVWDECYTLSEDLNEVLDVPWITVYRTFEDEESVDAVEPEIEGITGETADEIETVYSEEEGSIDVSRFFGESCYASSAVNTAKVYAYLTGTLGLNTAAACGIMTNIYAESGMLSNNLENTYNSKFGLSDSEYTSRVDKGKGAYKTSSGSSRNFRTDYCGYGLCQWTALSRRDALMTKALNKGTSVSDINMQLEFLAGELQNNYPEVWQTIKSVPNNASGAYLAAQHFCLAFEIPANTVSTAASRAKTAMSGYWKTYSGSAASVTADSYLGICGYTYPTAIKTGKGMSCKGYVISNYNISSVTASIVNSSGKAVYSKTLTPGTTAVNLTKVDSYMLFSKLSAGTYTYKIVAKDSKKTITVNNTFKVAATGSSTYSRGFATSNVTNTLPGSGATTPESTEPTEDPSSQQGTGTVTEETEPTEAPVITEATYTLNAKTNFRKGAGTSYKVKGKIAKGKTVTIIAYKNGWGKIKSNGYWISLRHGTIKNLTVKITNSNCKMRKGPGNGYASKGKIKPGTYKVKAARGKWFKLSHNNYWVSNYYAKPQFN